MAHEHDLGFQHDLPRLMGRRRALALVAGGAAVLGALPAAAQTCVAFEPEMAGPFPADGTNAKNGQTVNALTQQGVMRSDLRACFGGVSGTAKGAEYDLELTLVDVDGCAPLQGYAIYVWHCDALGDYSLYDNTEVNYLRGVGVSDAQGIVTFKTVFPGCYPGRWPHVHLEVFESADAAVSGRAALLTSQFAFTEEASRRVYEDAQAYPNSMAELDRLSLSRDIIFRNNAPAAMAQQTAVTGADVNKGNFASVTIPIRVTG